MAVHPIAGKPAERKPGISGRTTTIVIATALAVGLAAITLNALSADDELSVASASLLAGGAALATGGLLGFLFAIPKSVQAAAADRAYQPNTNLEQISDWLTKILVGVGLVELKEFRAQSTALVDFLAPSMGDERAFAAGLLVTCLTGGFLGAYLVTRLNAPRLFAEADRPLQERVDEIARVVDETRDAQAKSEAQAELDVRALTLVERQLTPGATQPVDISELTEALRQATPLIREQVFARAAQMRGAVWRDPATKPRLEVIIPVFQALLSADPDPENVHRYRAQLGFALKDLPSPRRQEAEEELSKAIAARGPWANGWGIYEFNRAACLIGMDADFEAGRKSSRELRDRVVADLELAMQESWIRGLIERNEERLADWMRLNDVPM